MSAAQARSSFDGLCLLRNLEPLSTIALKAQRDGPLLVETSSKPFVPAYFNRAGLPKDATMDFYSPP